MSLRRGKLVKPLGEDDGDGGDGGGDGGDGGGDGGDGEGDGKWIFDKAREGGAAIFRALHDFFRARREPAMLPRAVLEIIWTSSDTLRLRQGGSCFRFLRRWKLKNCIGSLVRVGDGLKRARET